MSSRAGSQEGDSGRGTGELPYDKRAARSEWNWHRDARDRGDRYFVTIPAAERGPVLNSVFHHITDQVVVMPLYYDASPSLISNRPVNVFPAYYGKPQLWDLTA